MKKLLLFGAIVLSTATFAQVPNYVPTNGLIGWWPFNGNANDESGNNLNGSLFGGIIDSDDRFGNPVMAYEFTNDSSGIIVNDDPLMDLGTEFTLSGWVKLNANFDSTQWIFSKSDFYDNRSYHANTGVQQAGPDAGDTIISFTTSSVGNSITCWYRFKDTLPVLDEWFHLSFVYNSNAPAGEKMKVYKNGISLNISYIVQDTGGDPATNSFPFVFGNTSDNGIYSSNSLMGNMDDWGMWNRNLTLNEIVALYNAPNTVGINTFESNNKMELVKIIDFLGRETEFKPNTPLIFIYSDGTRERVMKLE